MTPRIFSMRDLNTGLSLATTSRLTDDEAYIAALMKHDYTLVRVIMGHSVDLVSRTSHRIPTNRPSRVTIMLTEEALKMRKDKPNYYWAFAFSMLDKHPLTIESGCDKKPWRKVTHPAIEGSRDRRLPRAILEAFLQLPLVLEE